MTRLAYLSTDPGVAYGGTKGAAVHVGEVTRALAEAGTEVLLVASSVADGAPAAPEGVAVEVLPGPGKRSTTDERLAAEPDRAAWLRERLAGFGADVLYERLGLHSAAGGDAARALGIPHLVELNAPLPEEAARYRRLDRADDAERLERYVLARADAVFAVSEPLAAYATARGARRVEVLPNAVALERFAAARQRTGGRPTAVFTGTLRPWHGAETIAEAWALLGRDAPALLVVGDGHDRELLEAAGARVTGALPHASVPALLAQAQIGLAPYARAAPDYFSPLKLFEYLAAGLATVAADLPAVRAIVSEREALLVPRGDAGALAEAVAALADPERRERLGAAGRALVAAEHTWDRRARRILAVASECAGRRAEASGPAGAADDAALIEALGPIVGAAVRLERLKHKQGRRETLRASGPAGTAIVKRYASDRAPVVARRVAALAAGPSEPAVPAVLHVDAARRFVVLSDVPGEPLRVALLAGDGVACARAGAALGRWHAAWAGRQSFALRPHTAERERRILLERAAAASPEVARAVHSEVGRLTGDWRCSTVVHRDLYEEQVLTSDRVGLIDLDDAALGPPELDLGNLLGHVDLLALRNGRDLTAECDALAAGYADAGPPIDRALLDRCRRLTLLRLACLNDDLALVEREAIGT
jgi:glycosyltransferase involved in cell wall biosynthesis